MRGDTVAGGEWPLVSQDMTRIPEPDPDDGSGLGSSGDDADLPEEVESEEDEGATEGPEVVEEHRYDDAGMEVAGQTKRIVPRSRCIYNVRESKVSAWHAWVPGVILDMPRFYLQAMNPWALRMRSSLRSR